MALHAQMVGQGEPVVVLPAFGLDHRAAMEALEPAFGEAPGWARLYLDLPGTGSSTAKEACSDAVLDEVVATIADRLGDRSFAVAGWSYGGYLAAGLARRSPGDVRGLMLICAGLKIRPEDRDLTGVLESTPEDNWLTDIPPAMREHFSHAVGRQTADVAARFLAVEGANGPTDDVYLAALRAEGYRLSDEDAFSELNAPVCLVAGRRDRIVGYSDPFGALERFPQGDYVTLARAGHYLPVEEPQLFAQIVHTWLTRCHLGTPQLGR